MREITLRGGPAEGRTVTLPDAYIHSIRVPIFDDARYTALYSSNGEWIETTKDKNRWHEFTDDELWTLSLRLVDQDPHEYEWDAHALYTEVEAEIDRRRN